MSLQALLLGVEKTKEPEFEWPEYELKLVKQYVISQMKSVWLRSVDDNVMTNDEALSLFKLDKSPGYPWYFDYQTKGQVIDNDKERLVNLSDELMQAQGDHCCVFALSEKSELRDKEKVKLGKTRVFAGSPMEHLLASKRLYEIQNNDMVTNRHRIPIPLGIQMPGPEFITKVCSIGTAISADLSGCDQRFPLRIARMICEVRHYFLPDRYQQGGLNLYSQVYCGVGAVLGGIYRIYGNKSGWENTAHDNSLMSWIVCLVANKVLYPDQPIGSTFKAMFYSDDWVYKQTYGSAEDVFNWIRAHGVHPECVSYEHTPSTDIVFLSHHIRERFVRGLGDIFVVAGNLPKLMSSLSWVKKNKNLTYEESNVAHLLGLRMCLFPFPYEFEFVDGLLSKYLVTIVITPFIEAVLPARLTEYELGILHTRLESVSFFPIPGEDVFHNYKWVLKVAKSRPFKKYE